MSTNFEFVAILWTLNIIYLNANVELSTNDSVYGISASILTWYTIYLR